MFDQITTTTPADHHTSWCDAPLAAGDDHEDQCTAVVGRTTYGCCPGSHDEADVDVSVSSPFIPQDNLSDVDREHRSRQHVDAVQLAVCAHRTLLAVDLTPGAARSVAAYLNHAADVADGLR